MDTSAITASAALAGAAIGGLTSVITAWMTQWTLAHAQWRAEEKKGRQELYKEFIEIASKCYLDALQHDKADIAALVELHTKIGRMHLISSAAVIEAAERIEQKILDTYLEPDKSFLDLREMVKRKSISFLYDFSEAGRAEFRALRR